MEILLSCWMWTPEESRARNIHLDQSVYRWASWQGYVQDNEEIAETLHIKETTLNKHLQNLFRKLEVRSRWELLRKLRT